MNLINILYGSSCVGKSTHMLNSSNDFFKVEMDNTEFWTKEKKLWKQICLDYLIENIIKNKNTKKNMIITCGGLPLPSDPVYKEIEVNHSVVFKHTLILTKDKDQYLKQIKKRELLGSLPRNMAGRPCEYDELIESYKCRESDKDLYDEILINEGELEPN